MCCCVPGYVSGYVWHGHACMCVVRFNSLLTGAISGPLSVAVLLLPSSTSRVNWGGVHATRISRHQTMLILPSSRSGHARGRGSEGRAGHVALRVNPQSHVDSKRLRSSQRNLETRRDSHGGLTPRFRRTRPLLGAHSRRRSGGTGPGHTTACRSTSGMAATCC